MPALHHVQGYESLDEEDGEKEEQRRSDANTPGLYRGGDAGPLRSSGGTSSKIYLF